MSIKITIESTIDSLDTVVDALIATKSKHLLLEGELGAGKTTLVKHRLAAQGYNSDQVQSPTYTYMNSYEDGAILHADMRRIDEAYQLNELGIINALDTHDMCVIERPKRPQKYADSSRIHVTIQKKDPQTRIYTLTSYGS